MAAVEVVWSVEVPPVDATALDADLASNLLRRRLADALEVSVLDVTLMRHCPTCGGVNHGRPWVSVAGLPAPYVSLSRAPGIVMFAWSDAGPTGVDVELAHAADFDGFDSVGRHPDEPAVMGTGRAAAWVRKESLLKATGLGLTVDPRTIRLSPPGESPRLVEWHDGPVAPDQIWMYDVETLPAYAAAVTVLSPEPPDLVILPAARAGRSP